MSSNKTIEEIFVKDFDYNTINLLAKYKNSNLLLLFYNNKCLGCTGRAIPLAYEYKKEYDNVEVIGVHSNFGKAKTTKKDIGSIFTVPDLPFPIYLDENHSMFDAFNCEGTPHWILITKEKIVYKSIFGSQVGAQNRLYYALESLK